RRAGVVGCCAWTGASLIFGSGEIWIALHALGLHATLVNSVILQSMVLTIRNVMFPVQGAIGVQEGGYVLVVSSLGIAGDAAFAVRLMCRLRELILGISGLVVWQLIAGRRVFRAGLAANARSCSRSASTPAIFWRRRFPFAGFANRVRTPHE